MRGSRPPSSNSFVHHAAGTPAQPPLLYIEILESEAGALRRAGIGGRQSSASDRRVGFVTQSDDFELQRALRALPHDAVSRPSADQRPCQG